MSDHSKTTLSRLVERCRAGDKRAWYQLIDFVSPLVFSICRKTRLSREESFDVFGQVCYAMLKNIHRLRSTEKVLSYVATTTKREAHALTRRSRFFAYLDREQLDTFSDSPEKTPERIFERTRQSEMLMKALISLPEREHRLIRALFLEHDRPSYKAISKRLGIPVSSIGPTRARSLVKLCRILKRKGYNFSHKE